MGLFGKNKYQYAPGTPGADLPTAQTHIAVPTSSAQQAEWEATAGHRVAGRAAWYDGEYKYLTPDAMEYWARERDEWEGEAGL